MFPTERRIAFEEFADLSVDFEDKFFERGSVRGIERP